MPAGSRWTKPQGGFFSWLTLPDGADSVDLARRAVEHGVGIVPGTLFFADGRGARHRSTLVQPRRRGADRRRDRAARVAPVSTPRATHYRWDDLPKEAAEAGPGTAADLDRADDAGAGLPRAGLHRPAALARERAADLHPRGQAPLLARRGRVGGRRRRCRARCCTSRPGCRTRPKRSRRRSTSTSSARRGRTGSTAPTPTYARSEARARRAPRARHRRVEGARRGDRARARRARAPASRSAPGTRTRCSPRETELGAAHAQAADVTDPEQVRDFVARSAEALGGVDFLVNNAGGAHPGTFESADRRRLGRRPRRQALLAHPLLP